MRKEGDPRRIIDAFFSIGAGRCSTFRRGASRERSRRSATAQPAATSARRGGVGVSLPTGHRPRAWQAAAVLVSLRPRDLLEGSASRSLALS